MILYMKNIENTNINKGAFRFYEPKPQSFLQRLFKQQPEENALIALNNLFVEKDVMQVSLADVQQIEHRYKVKFSAEKSPNLEEFYATLLMASIAIGELLPDDRNRLDQLAKLLGLSTKQVAFFREAVGKIAFQNCYENVVAKRRMNADDWNYLEGLKKNIGISQAAANKIGEEIRTATLLEYFKKMIANQRLSPQEDEKFADLSERLKIKPNLNKDTQVQLECYREYWRIENLELTTLEADIEIQKSESCYLMVSKVDYYEPRSLRSKYGGTYDKLLDSGKLYLTQKRIILVGALKNYIIKLDQIERISKPDGGVVFSKITGRPVTLKLNAHERTKLLLILKKWEIN